MEKGVVLRLFSLHLEIIKRLLSDCIPSAHSVATCLCVSYFMSFLKRKLIIGEYRKSQWGSVSWAIKTRLDHIFGVVVSESKGS